MQLLNRTPTKQYFVSTFIMVSALFITFSSIIYNYQSEAQRLNNWTLYNYEVARQERSILFNLLDMETGVRGYLLTGQRSFLDPYNTAKAALESNVGALSDFAKDDVSIQKDLIVWRQKINDFVHQSSIHVRLRSEGKVVGPDVLERQKGNMDELRQLLENNIYERLKELQTQLDQAASKQSNFKYILILGTILAIGGILLGTLVVLALIKRSESAEVKAHAAEERFLTVMHGIDDGLYDIELKDGEMEGAKFYFSPTYKSMLGYSDEEFPNTLDAARRLLHPEDEEEALENFRRYLRGETPNYTGVFRQRHKDGNWIWILSRGVGLRDAQGRLTRVIGTHTDITEQKSREEELRQLNAEMETFTYITSHDLRAPLVNLKGFSGEMERSIFTARPIIAKVSGTLSAEDQKTLQQVFEEDIPESLRFIKQAVVKMDSLTTAVLNLSSIGKRVYRFVPVDTQEVVTRCLDTLNYEMEQKQITVECGPLPTIVCDPVAIEQIFSNILDNAVKYSVAGKAGTIRIAAEQRGTLVTFSISDSGRGIVEADREKIFQIFRRARNTDDIRGLGMGMTFVQATLRRLGGTIWFDSKPGVGTVFYFRLPMRTVLTREEAA